MTDSEFLILEILYADKSAEGLSDNQVINKCESIDRQNILNILSEFQKLDYTPREAILNNKITDKGKRAYEKEKKDRRKIKCNKRWGYWKLRLSVIKTAFLLIAFLFSVGVNIFQYCNHKSIQDKSLQYKSTIDSFQKVIMNLEKLNNLNKHQDINTDSVIINKN